MLVSIRLESVSRKGLDLNGVLLYGENGCNSRFVLGSSREPVVMQGQGVECFDCAIFNGVKLLMRREGDLLAMSGAGARGVCGSRYLLRSLLLLWLFLLKSSRVSVVESASC